MTATDRIGHPLRCCDEHEAYDPRCARGDLCDRCGTRGGVKYLPLGEPTEFVCVECMTPDERKATGWT